MSFSFRESNSTTTSSKAAPNTASRNSPICPITNSGATIWASSPSSKIQTEKSTKEKPEIHRKSSNSRNLRMKLSIGSKKEPSQKSKIRFGKNPFSSLISKRKLRACAAPAGLFRQLETSRALGLRRREILSAYRSRNSSTAIKKTA